MNDTAVVERRVFVPDAKVEKGRPVAVASEPMALIAHAVQSGASLEYVTQLMNLRDRMEATEARKAFDEAMSASKAEIKPIVKNREVDFTSSKGRTNYKYEDLAAIADSVDPILAKYGLSYRHRAKQEGMRLTITCVMSHRLGHSEETSLCASNDESGNKNSIQAVASVATYLQRYTLKLALGLATANDDDGRGGEPKGECISDKQAADLGALITELGGNVEKLKRYWKINLLTDIPVKNLEAVIKDVRAFAKQAQEIRK